MDFILIDLPSLIVKNLSGYILEGILLILIFFIIFLVLLIKNKTLHPNATSLPITIGICFTFYGISKGLAGFNTEHSDEDLPQFIGGIKLHFSICNYCILCYYIKNHYSSLEISPFSRNFQQICARLSTYH